MYTSVCMTFDWNRTIYQRKDRKKNWQKKKSNHKKNETSSEEEYEVNRIKTKSGKKEKYTKDLFWSRNIIFHNEIRGKYESINYQWNIKEL